MKKILILTSLAIFGLGFGQYSQDGYYGGNDDGWYDTYDEGYFPDDYYYDYPNDYYSDEYYRNMYNDYRNSVVSINWNRFFAEARLTPYQINLIVNLNRQYPSYSSWNSYYRVNPVRWYYDRFYAIRQILGPQLFVVFQNDFYRGYSPVVYYTNYWREYYRPRYVCRPRYRNVNISVYRVNRFEYHRDRGNYYGNRSYNPRNPSISEGNRNGGRVGAPNTVNPDRNSGWQGNSSNSTRNDGFRSGTGENTPDTRRSVPERTRVERPDVGNTGRNQGGFRTNSAPQIRNRTESSPRISAPRSSERRDTGGQSSSRNNGMRLISR